MNEELLQLIKTRRSVRAFRPDRPVSEEQIQTLLEGARWAPSGGNVQPWRFSVVRDASLRKQLATAALGQSFVAEAPVVIVVCVHLPEAQARYGARGRDLYSLQDTAAAVQNMLLLAHSMGLGTCWVGAFDEPQAAQALDLPEALRPVALIPVGYPDEQPRAPGRKGLAEVVTYR